MGYSWQIDIMMGPGGGFNSAGMDALIIPMISFFADQLLPAIVEGIKAIVAKFKPDKKDKDSKSKTEKSSKSTFPIIKGLVQKAWDGAKKKAPSSIATMAFLLSNALANSFAGITSIIKMILMVNVDEKGNTKLSAALQIQNRFSP